MSESIDLENIHLAKIGVILDMDNGLICFLNPDSNNDIVSYPRKNIKITALFTQHAMCFDFLTQKTAAYLVSIKQHQAASSSIKHLLPDK